MELLTVVLTILADGGFALQCPVIADNREIYLEGAEAVEFLRKRKRKHNKKWVRTEKRGKERRQESHTNLYTMSNTLSAFYNSTSYSQDMAYCLRLSSPEQPT